MVIVIINHREPYLSQPAAQESVAQKRSRITQVRFLLNGHALSHAFNMATVQSLKRKVAEELKCVNSIFSIKNYNITMAAKQEN